MPWQDYCTVAFACLCILSMRLWVLFSRGISQSSIMAAAADYLFGACLIGVGSGSPAIEIKRMSVINSQDNGEWVDRDLSVIRTTMI